LLVTAKLSDVVEVLALRVIIRLKKRVNGGEMILQGSILDGKVSTSIAGVFVPNVWLDPGFAPSASWEGLGYQGN
jgi:hypothetical protein